MSASGETVFELEGLTKTFRSRLRHREIRAVRDVSLRVLRGSVVAFVGPNGAGKTTTIYTLLGLLRPDQGTVRLFGLSAGSLEARRRTGFQSEIFYTYGFKTASGRCGFTAASLKWQTTRSTPLRDHTMRRAATGWCSSPW